MQSEGDLPPRSEPPSSGHPLTDEELRAVIRAVLNLLKRWELSSIEKTKLLSVSADVLLRWEDGDVAETRMEDTNTLIDLLVIHGCLCGLLAKAEVYSWVRKRNAVWHGRSALDVMTEEGGIVRVRQYLDAEVQR
jgi:hypothetical protein